MRYCSHVRAACHPFFNHAAGSRAPGWTAPDRASLQGPCTGVVSSRARRSTALAWGARGEDKGRSHAVRPLRGRVQATGTPAWLVGFVPAPACTHPSFTPLGSGCNPSTHARCPPSVCSCLQQLLVLHEPAPCAVSKKRTALGAELPHIKSKHS